jgi:LacI family transcriptional regulator
LGRATGQASITIYDVAEAAGVSIKTVSRVLNRESNVRAETREQVLAAVSALNYRPNIAARSLAGARAYLIGLLFDNPSAGYMSDIQLGVTARCRAQGYHVVVEPLDCASPDAAAQVAGLLDALKLDGLILTPPVCDHSGVLDLLDARRTPYVRISPEREPARAPRVQVDDRAAAFQLTQRLLELGHREIGFIRGHPGHGASHLRYAGYVDALARQGLQPAPERVEQGYFTFRSGVEAAERLLDRPGLTAVFASNDDMALGAMTVAARRGLEVPRDLSVAGFDDTPAARVVWPQLTTVRQPAGDMAAVAADLLIARDLKAAGGGFAARELDFALIERASTGPVAARA